MTTYPQQIIDQTGFELLLKRKPGRIVSLVPSQTELLFDLHLNKEVTGITKFCTHPDQWFRSKTRVGGTKKLNIDIIRQLQPDLILGNKEENEKSQIEILRREFPVWISDIVNLKDALHMIREIGLMTSTEVRAGQIASEIERNFDTLLPLRKPLRTLYLIWNQPHMCAGNGTFISEMLEYCGLKNVAGGNRYPELSDRDITEINPELILLSSEPFPFNEKHLNRFRELAPCAKIKLVDGEMFSWYGSRLLHAPRYFNTLLSDLR